MEDLTINKFLNGADDYLANTVIGNEEYRIKLSSGKAILISEEVYKKLKEKGDTKDE